MMAVEATAGEFAGAAREPLEAQNWVQHVLDVEAGQL